MRKLGTEQRLLLAEATARYRRALTGPPSACSDRAWEYLAARGLDGVAERYRLGVVTVAMPGHERMAGRLAIPYLTPAGPVTLKFRCIEHADCKEVKCPKYLGIEDSGVRLYNARAVLAATDTVVICEGEFDAMAVSGVAGIPAVGYPGAGAWARKESAHWPRVFAGLEVVVVADGDPAGIEAARAVAKSIDAARLVVLPAGEDSNSLIAKEGPDDFVGRLGIQRAAEHSA